ncbi:MAG TPA: AAA family ATPase, partial [Anaerovoracaceae bacterium]|nr:AAA family ATPase [Anaerovoracaceae bacterium]
DLYRAAFGEARETYSTFSLIDIDELKKNEECSLLGQRISGSSDTPVGKFIEYLQNSDWVNQGIGYAVKADSKCPYCQQPLPTNVQSDIEAFFDETYEKDCAAVRAFQTQYEAYFAELVEKLKAIADNPIPMLSYELFKAELDILDKAIKSNKIKFQNKVASPSNAVSIDSLELIVLRINKIIGDYNTEITKNNDIVKNQTKEQERCKKLLWQYITYELRTVIRKYHTDLAGKTSGISSLKDKIKEESDKKTAHEKLITEKEEILTSVVPTVNAINGILKRFGFDGFSLAENPDEKGTYKIIRQNGSNAKKTLSEGEYNFITFLYFYHLAYGSQEKTGIEEDKVVVVDDPISSLDSNVLFIISTLVRTLIKDCYKDEKGIKQVFILTHNVYFHKEVSYWGNRETPSPKLVTYWIVKKVGNVSDIINHEKNPIQTSYELLWSELQEVDSTPRITIFNTIRRILEYYFNVIGGLEYDKCIDLFEDEDKIVCKALISCINDGSHFISDDFVMCYEAGAMENYLRIFELIFEKLGHGNHYDMMMNRTKILPVMGTNTTGDK